MTKQEALKNHKDAYAWADKHGPCDETRKVACQDSYYAFRYAKDVDQSPRDDTRAASCQCQRTAYLYADFVDNGFHPETWDAVQGSVWEEEYKDHLGSPPAPSRVPAITKGTFTYQDVSFIPVDPYIPKEEDPNEGKIYNPITEEWSWF